MWEPQPVSIKVLWAKTRFVRYQSSIVMLIFVLSASEVFVPQILTICYAASLPNTIGLCKIVYNIIMEYLYRHNTLMLLYKNVEGILFWYLYPRKDFTNWLQYHTLLIEWLYIGCTSDFCELLFHVHVFYLNVFIKFLKYMVSLLRRGIS